MSAMLKCDLACLRSTWKTLIGTSLFVAVMLGIGMGVVAIVPMMCVMIPLTFVMNSLFFNDDQNGWQAWRLTLPISRAQVVLGRYATGLVMLGIGLVLGIVIAGACGAIALGLLDTLPNMAALLPDGFGMGELAYMLACTGLFGLAVGLLLLAFVMPPAVRVGMTKAVRYLPLLAVAGFVVVMLVIGNTDGMGASPAATFLIDLVQGGGVMALGGACLLVAAALYAVSCAVSVRLYAGRSF